MCKISKVDLEHVELLQIECILGITLFLDDL